MGVPTRAGRRVRRARPADEKTNQTKPSARMAVNRASQAGKSATNEAKSSAPKAPKPRERTHLGLVRGRIDPAIIGKDGAYLLSDPIGQARGISNLARTQDLLQKGLVRASGGVSPCPVASTLEDRGLTPPARPSGTDSHMGRFTQNPGDHVQSVGFGLCRLLQGRRIVRFSARRAKHQL